MINTYETEQWQKMSTFHPGGEELTKRLMNDLRSFGLKQGLLLDVGCGRGDSAALLSGLGYELTGIDISGRLLAKAAARCPEGAFHLACAEELPFVQESFDAALVECTLSGADTGCVLDELYRVLKPDGLLIVSDLYDKNNVPESASKSYWEGLFRRHHFQELLWHDEPDALKAFMSEWIWKNLVPCPLCNAFIHHKEFRGEIGYFSAVYRREA